VLLAGELGQVAGPHAPRERRLGRRFNALDRGGRCVLLDAQGELREGWKSS